ncbi:MAG: hypothetical protein K2K25_07730 [Muribaculaceae bacterium]|nr:hypothetical protein [Muribaculaceae bacterium]
MKNIHPGLLHPKETIREMRIPIIGAPHSERLTYRLISTFKSDLQGYFHSRCLRRFDLKTTDVWVFVYGILPSWEMLGNIMEMLGKC